MSKNIKLSILGLVLGISLMSVACSSSDDSFNVEEFKKELKDEVNKKQETVYVDRFNIQRVNKGYNDGEIYILTDKETDIQYLYTTRMYSQAVTQAVTPLLDKEGKPLIDKK